jgi:subtilisin family serine protease
MSYIITLRGKVSRYKLKKIAGKDVFISKLLPIIIVEELTDKLVNAQFIENIKLEDTGTLQALKLIPPVYEGKLQSLGLTGLGQVVAVIDSGFDSSSLAKHIEEQIDFTNTHDVIDRYGHGTVVAKIINKCAPGARLINLKVTSNKEIGEANIIKALEWLYFRSNIHIVNMSLSVMRDTRCNGECFICKLVKMIYEKGVIIVAAAGNSGPSMGTISCPAIAPEAIAVGSIDMHNKVASFSSRGYDGQIKPDMLTSGYNTTKNQYFRSGTSFSSPIIAGIVACIRPLYNDIEQLKATLFKSTVKIRANEQEQGNGVLSISKLMEVLNDDEISDKSL